MRTLLKMPDLPDELPWSSNAFLLLDGVSLREMPRKLYQWSENPRFIQLYGDTRWHEVRELSPCLIQLEGRNDPILHNYLENAGQEWGYLLFSADDLLTVAEHLRSLLTVRVPPEEEMLLRLADPAVAHCLMASGKTRLFGPIRQLCIPDALDGVWRQHRPCEDRKPYDPATLYSLNETEIEALGAVSFRQTVMDLDEHMNRFFPNYRPILQGRERLKHCFRLAEDAYARGFCSEREITLYANIFGLLGEQALQTHPDIAVLLEERSSLTPLQRIEQAAAIAEQRSTQTGNVPS